MSIDFSVQRANFDMTKGIRQIQNLTFNFANEVVKAEAAINGFDVRFNNADHPLHRLEINCANNPRIIGPGRRSVEVEVAMLLRDHSGEIDDEFGGTIDVLCIAQIK